MSTQLQIVGCPHCGGTRGFTWKVHSAVLEMVNHWGAGRPAAKLDRISEKRKSVWAKCLDCDKRVRISRAEAVPT